MRPRVVCAENFGSLSSFICSENVTQTNSHIYEQIRKLHYRLRHVDFKIPLTPLKIPPNTAKTIKILYPRT